MDVRRGDPLRHRRRLRGRRSPHDHGRVREATPPETETERSTQDLLEALPEWVQLGLGCDDMTDAFRQSPVVPEHQGINVVAFYAPSRGHWVFSEVYGLVYGMKSSVLHFNRFPALCAATARRMGGAATGSYVDDFTTIDFAHGRRIRPGLRQPGDQHQRWRPGPGQAQAQSGLNRSCSESTSAWTAS